MSERDSQPNSRLAAMICQAGLTYDAVARAVRQVAAENGDRTLRANKSAVAHWVAGTRPHPRTAGYLVEALSRRMEHPLHLADLGIASKTDQVPIFQSDDLPEDPVAAVAQLGRADVDRRTMLANAVYSITALTLPLARRDELSAQAARVRSRRVAKVGNAEVCAVLEVTRAFNQVDEQLGGGHARRAVVEYLSTDVAAYCQASFVTEVNRQAMFGAAAQLAYLAGWKAHDLRLEALAQRYYLHSYQLASEADPHGHAGYAMRILAHQAFDLGRHEHCVDLAEAALSRVAGHVDPDTESLFWLTLARAHASDGDSRLALNALTRGEKLLEQTGAEERPPWVSLGGPAEARLTNQAGKALMALGELRAAEQQLRRSAAGWDPATHPRIYALTLADLAEAQCVQGKVEQACHTWNTVLDHLPGVRSARTRDAVDSMRRHLTSYHRRGFKAAQRLDARAIALQSQWR
jgi:hypothetical protein